MKEKLNEVKVFVDYTVRENNDKEIKIMETTRYSDMVNAYMRELVIKKDKQVITTWLNALGDKELLNVYSWIKEIMEERGINVR